LTEIPALLSEYPQVHLVLIVGPSPRFVGGAYDDDPTSRKGPYNESSS